LLQGISRLDKAWRYLFILLPYALIYSIAVSNGIIISLLLLSLYEFFLQRKESVMRMTELLFASLIFIVTLISITYSSNQRVGLSIAETRLPLLFLPLLLATKTITYDIRNIFIKHFIYSLLVTMGVTLCIAVYRNILGPGPDIWFNKWYYHYSDLTEPINIDPLYLALFVSFGILILICDEITDYGEKIFQKKTYKRAVIFLLSFFLVLLGSRSIILILLGLTIVVVFSQWQSLGLRKIALIGLLLICIVSAAFLSPVTRERFVGLFKAKYEFSQYSVDRFIIWTVAYHYVKEHPSEFVIGKGAGTSEGLMDSLYKKENINWDFEKKSNTHNQYLEFALNTGIIGMTVLIVFLVASLMVFLKSQDRLAIVFILLIMLAMVSENYLNRQKGVVFFSMFYSLFWFVKPLRDVKKQDAC
jgi:O-antigen ligase